VTKIYRVVVRGQFDGLNDLTRSKLSAEADDHDFLLSAFTSEGTFTYDDRLIAFNFRYEMRGDDGAADESTAIGNEALARAVHWLNRAGYGHKRLRATVTDMATMWDR
jgi:Family of unknown function (DUF6204)